jgi:hypothetical protein
MAELIRPEAARKVRQRNREFSLEPALKRPGPSSDETDFRAMGAASREQRLVRSAGVLAIAVRFIVGEVQAIAEKQFR